MSTLFAMVLLATVSASSGTHSWVKDSQVHVRFYDLTKIVGPLKFYVNGISYPTALCSNCPPGAPASFVVPPEQVIQSWPQGGKYLEVTFPCSAVGGMEQFYFTAVSCLATEDVYLGTGAVPNEPLKGNRR